MRKAIKLLCIVAIVSLTFISCSTDNDGGGKLLKRVEETATNGSTTTTYFTYNGAKIASMDVADRHTEFTYSGNVITGIVMTDNANSTQDILEYTYIGGEVTKITSSLNYTLNYTHNVDGSVSYNRVITDAAVLVFHGTLYFENGNLIRDERTQDDDGDDIITTQTMTYEHDSKVNPMHNITGFEKLLNYFELVSVNNVGKTYEEHGTYYVISDQGISSANVSAAAFKYDGSGYPTEVATAKEFMGNLNTYHAKTQFFYN